MEGLKLWHLFALMLPTAVFIPFGLELAIRLCSYILPSTRELAANNALLQKRFAAAQKVCQMRYKQLRHEQAVRHGCVLLTFEQYRAIVSKADTQGLTGWLPSEVEKG